MLEDHKRDFRKSCIKRLRFESQFSKVKFKRFESWRSARSLKNIEINILSLEAFFLGSHAGNKGLNLLLSKNEFSEILENFKATLKEIQQINTPLEESSRTSLGYQSTESLIASLTTLHANLEKAITHSGIRLGFNSRDGD